MKTRKNNKGFSLVELIVVVAIMAVLVGVLAPAYLKYVEKSRKSTDISAMANVMEAMTISASDIELNLANGDTMTAKWTNDTVSFEATGSNSTKVVDELNAILGTVTLKSADFKDGNGAITGTVGADGKVTFTSSGNGDEMKAYSTDFAKKFS